jgi:acyl transferase domain-containing protein
MGLDIYKAEPVFRLAIDECTTILQELGYEDIREIMFPKDATQEADRSINNTRYAQPALFSIEYALSRLWMSWGIRPSAFAGHSIGEFVAAHLSGVFTLRDGLTLVANRSRLMADLPTGSMLGIRHDYKVIQSLLPAELDLAAVNSPALCTVSGPAEAITAFALLLDEKGIQNRPLHTSHAFHSAMMDPILTPFEAVVRSIRLNIFPVSRSSRPLPVPGLQIPKRPIPATGPGISGPPSASRMPSLPSYRRTTGSSSRQARATWRQPWSANRR